MSLLAAGPKVHAVCAIGEKKWIFHGSQLRFHTVSPHSPPSARTLRTGGAPTPLPPQQRKELRGRPGQPGRDEEGVRDWGAQGTASGAGELVLVPVQVECVQMFGDRGWGWSRDKPRLVLMNSAGRHSNWTTSTIPSNPKVLAPLGGQGGNGGREKTESGGTGPVPG